MASHNARDKSPTVAQMELAAEWLDINESEPGEECTAMRVVAEWLRAQAAAKELRETAKEHGVPVGRLRAKLKEVANG